MAKNAQNFEQRPWGSFEVLHEFTVANADGSAGDVVVKRITVLPQKRLSYQEHNKRQEFWTFVQGTGVATLDGIEQNVSANQSLHIAKKMKHRIANTSDDQNLVFIEVSTGEFDEFDNIRHEDDFGRV